MVLCKRPGWFKNQTNKQQIKLNSVEMLWAILRCLWPYCHLRNVHVRRGPPQLCWVVGVVGPGGYGQYSWPSLHPRRGRSGGGVWGGKEAELVRIQAWQWRHSLLPFHSEETRLWTLINVDALFLSGLSCVAEIKKKNKFFQPVSFKSGVPF